MTNLDSVNLTKSAVSDIIIQYVRQRIATSLNVRKDTKNFANIKEIMEDANLHHVHLVMKTSICYCK